MASLLRVRNLRVRYGSLVAVDNVSLIVPPASIVALLGANGAGKTTLLRAISGMVPPYAGEIWFEQRRIDGEPDYRIARLGLAHVPEGRGVFRNLSVEENLRMATAGGRSVGAFEEAFRLFPALEGRHAQLARTLSGGEQQMLALARALLARPRLLMVDEPSLGLAPRVVTQLLQTLDEIRRAGTSVLLVEQHVRHALRVADVVAVLAAGRLRFLGEPGELADDSTLLESYLGSAGRPPRRDGGRKGARVERT